MPKLPLDDYEILKWDRGSVRTNNVCTPREILLKNIHLKTSRTDHTFSQISFQISFQVIHPPRPIAVEKLFIGTSSSVLYLSNIINFALSYLP